ncbi:cupin domain-containing protein [Aspergillus undulatus]|uniref:cupin domain-containing protein n=1 Tax=Aspergillus undulatus TaxID=1810928 RepID=UPI003CCCD888
MILKLLFLSFTLLAIWNSPSASAFTAYQNTPPPVSKSIVLSPSALNTTISNTTFTGKVYQNPIQSVEHASSAFVTFTPSSRTYWHTHEEGQLLHVTAGHGWIADLGGVPRRLEAGDVIWAPPGTTHWHGADEGSLLTHLAVGLGETRWAREVSLEEYREGRE